MHSYLFGLHILDLNVVGIVTGYGPQTLSYQWTANGGDLNNGETSFTREIGNSE